jgi:hypothetical protein
MKSSVVGFAALVVLAAIVIVGGASVAFGPFGGVMDPVPTIRLTMPDGPEAALIAFDPFSGDMTVTYQAP